MRLFGRYPGGNTFGGGALASGGLFAIAMLIALGLALLTVAGAWTLRLADVVGPRLAGDATVAVWGRGLESADAAVARTAEILSARPGISAVALEPDVTDAWVGALLGGVGHAGDGPRLVSIRTAAPGAAIIASIKHLQAAGITARADDHRDARGPLEQRVILAGTVAAGATLLLSGALFLCSVAAGRSLVARHRQRVDLMIRIGARRGFLARLVTRRVGLIVMTGVLVGLVAGEGLVLLALGPGLTGTLPASGPSLVDGLTALAWGPLMFLIAIAGAGLGAHGGLKRAERVG